MINIRVCGVVVQCCLASWSGWVNLKLKHFESSKTSFTFIWTRSCLSRSSDALTIADAVLFEHKDWESEVWLIEIHLMGHFLFYGISPRHNEPSLNTINGTFSLWIITLYIFYDFCALRGNIEGVWPQSILYWFCCGLWGNIWKLIWAMHRIIVIDSNWFRCLRKQ